jgi:hypothetical protein
MMQPDQWVQVATTASQLEAEMLRDVLGGEGIRSLVQSSDAAAYLGVISPCRILVPAADQERAAEFLVAWREAEPHVFDDAAAPDAE